MSLWPEWEEPLVTKTIPRVPSNHTKILHAIPWWVWTSKQGYKREKKDDKGFIFIHPLWWVFRFSKMADLPVTFKAKKMCEMRKWRWSHPIPHLLHQIPDCLLHIVQDSPSPSLQTWSLYKIICWRDYVWLFWFAKSNCFTGARPPLREHIQRPRWRSPAQEHLSSACVRRTAGQSCFCLSEEIWGSQR